MTTAYGGHDSESDGMGKGYAQLLPWIPMRAQLRDGHFVTIDFLHSSSDVQAVKELLNVCIADGNSWPFNKEMSEKEFRAYFLAHTAIVLRSDSTQVIAAFYCKPNFPGRCNHFCNGGFITEQTWRRRGVAQLMAIIFLRAARCLNFRASLFNLVFEHNVPSINLWNKLGFVKVGTLPGVVRLDGDEGFRDAYQYYFDLTILDDHKLGKLIKDGGYRNVQNIAEAARLPVANENNP